VADLGSTNGTYLNGERLRGESRWLSNGDTVMVGGEPIRFLAGEATRLGGQIPQALIKGTRTIQFDGSQLTLGRDPSNHVVLDDPNVSRFHAEVVAVNGGYELRDLGSRNGTRLNGQLIVDRLPIQVGSEIGVGPFRLIFDGAAFVARDDRGSLRLLAEQLTVDVKGKRILDDASVEVQPGEFVAIIGESGSGKTTMIKALAGVSHPSAGTVTVNGEPVASRLSEIGYVPQDEIVHRDLSVREALTYAARLRLPQDTNDQEIRAAVDSNSMPRRAWARCRAASASAPASAPSWSTGRGCCSSTRRPPAWIRGSNAG
jgi:pSer/pThr/pTyr-binding forkhead associated (FHA) protein